MTKLFMIKAGYIVS